MKYKILACDMDGTLLNSEGKLTAVTKAAVRLAEDNGLKVVLSTGRPYQGVLSVAKACGLTDGAFILYNGAMIVNGGKIAYALNLPKRVAETIVDEGHKRDSVMIMWNDGKLYAEKPSKKVDFYKIVSNVEPIFVGDLKNVCNDTVTKVLWYDDPVSTPKFCKEMKEILQGKCACYISRADFLEFVNAQCSKKTALQKVAEELGADMSETVAVGDGYNDLPMLEGAGLSVAMGNAAKDLKDKCDLVTGSCDDDGVAELIYKLLNLG